MSGASSILAQVDAQLDQLFAGWNIYSTLICVALITYLIVPLFFFKEPDVHPLLLARQSTPTRVRQPRESAVYRSLETPHGYPLRSGLNVKDPGTPKWTSGRDGDLRDVWKRAKDGPVDNEGKPTGQSGSVSTVMGRDQVARSDFNSLSADVSSAGAHLKSHGGQRVAIYLSNSQELLVTLFACAFYGLTPILVPQEQPIETLAGMLKDIKADALVVGAGVVPLDQLMKYYPSLKQVIWVVPPTSRHMDWTEVSEGEGGKADIATWHEVIEGDRTQELPTDLPNGEAPPNVVMVSNDVSKSGAYTVVELTQKNIVAAMSAQIAVLPRPNRLGPSDLLIPLASLTDIFPLTVTLTALFSNASLAFTPTSGPKALYSSAFQSIEPTVIVAHPQTLSSYCQNQEKSLLSGAFGGLIHKRRLQTLESGRMPQTAVSSQKLRLLYTYDRVGATSPPLTASQLSNLRIFTGARMIYAITDAHVAGAICQTNMLDYQSHGLRAEGASHFGPPLSCLEIKLKEAHEGDMNDDKPFGKVVVLGPAVVGGEQVLDKVMMMTDSNTLAYPS